MTKDSLKAQLRRTLGRDLWIAVVPAVLLIGAAFAVTLGFVKPAPPKKLLLAMAPDEGGFRYYAKKYQDALAKHGITLELRQTQGSVSNVKLLTAEDGEVDVAFVQSGTKPGDQAESIVSLGSLSYVPLWVFYRGEPIEDLTGSWRPMAWTRLRRSCCRSAGMRPSSS
jgi:hypothetical protein